VKLFTRRKIGHFGAIISKDKALVWQTGTEKLILRSKYEQKRRLKNRGLVRRPPPGLQWSGITGVGDEKKKNKTGRKIAFETQGAGERGNRGRLACMMQKKGRG